MSGSAPAPAPVAARTLLTWAARNIVVQDGPRTGKRFRPASAPWAGVAAALDDPAHEQVTVRGPVQSGKTALLIVAALWHMRKGRSVLILEPNEALRLALSSRIRRWGRACRDPVIAAAYALDRLKPHKRELPNGGRLEVVNAGAGDAGLFRTAEVVIVDELRVFAKDMLGELVDRMAAYGGKGKLITASSAGYEGECRTSVELDKSDSRRWFLRCPDCGRENVAQWENFRMPKGRSPFYAMPCCGTALSTAGLRKAVAGGQWKATQSAPVVGTVGFHLDCFLSGFETVRTIARMWQRARTHQKQTGSMAEIIAFQCGRLALPFKPEAAGGVTADAIGASLTRPYAAGIVPAEASVLVIACDVQDNRLEAELSAWGVEEVEGPDAASQVKGWGGHEFRGLGHGGKWYRLRRWAMEYRRLYGDPGLPDVWEALAAFAEEQHPHAAGPLLRPVTTVIDIGGHYGTQVADFVRTRGQGYQCIKGLSGQTFGAVLMRKSVTADSLETYGAAGLGLVCTNSGKASVFSLLRAGIAGTADPPPMVWPADPARYGPEEYNGIASEHLSRTIDKRTGRTTLRWKKHHRENEPLDVLVYSLAAVSHLGVGFLLHEADAIRAAADMRQAA